MNLHQITEQERLLRGRRGELSLRPTTAEIYVSPILHTAVLRLENDNKNVEQANIVHLPGTYAFPCRDLQEQAEPHLVQRGFRLHGPWQEKDATDRHRAPITPTREYLAYVEALYGPEPDVAELFPLSLEVHRAQRGWWRITNERKTWTVTRSPFIDGEHWTVWAGADATELMGTYDNADDAVARVLALAADTTNSGS